MKIKIFLLATVIVLALIIFFRIRNEEKSIPRSLFKQRGLILSDVIGAPAFFRDINFDILADVQKAKEILAKYPIRRDYKATEMWAWIDKRKEKKRHWVKKELKGFDVLLAVENIGTRKISVVAFDPKNGKSLTPGFEVILEKENGVNSQFNVTHPDSCIVLAIKRPIKMKKGGKEDAIYSPYSPALDIPQVRKCGFEYLRAVISSAKLKLQTAQVHSLVFPDSLVSGMIPLDIAEVLVIIEHIDPNRFLNGVPVGHLVSEVLTIVGLNGKDAYKYAVSPAGARGLFQFMPRTYGVLLHEYPDAGLEKNFVAGMDNHVNAAIASFLLFDSNLSYADVKQQYVMLKDPRALGLYLASSYNGGAVRTVKAMQKHGDGWVKGLLPETRIYLEKYATVSGMVQ